MEDKVHYEVWEFPEGSEPRLACQTLPHREQAERIAREWIAEAEERFASESLGPMKPKPTTFRVVRVTEIRELF